MYGHGERYFTDKRVVGESVCPDCGRLEHYVRKEIGVMDLCITIPADDHPAPPGFMVIQNKFGERDFVEPRHVKVEQETAG